MDGLDLGTLFATLALNDTLTPGLQQAGQGLSTFGGQAATAGLALTASITAPLALLGSTALSAAMDFESSFAGVQKTVNATEAEFVVFAEGLRAMALEIPISVNELNRIAEAAGQLGIQNENLLSFTRVMADLGVSTNMSAEEAATSLARLANITQMSQSDFDRLGSTIVALGNNFATTEAEIVEMGLRLAGAGHQIGLAESEILGIAAALTSLGINAEAGGTAMSRVMVEIANAVASGNEHLAQFAAIAGQTSEVFAASFREDAAGALVTFIEGLGSAAASGENLFGILESIGLSDIRVRDALLRMAGGGDILRAALDLANQAWIENTALTAEAERRYATTAAQLQIFWNRVNDVQIILGGPLAAALTAVIDALSPFIPLVASAAETFASWPSGVQLTIIGLGGLSAAIGPFLLLLGGMASGVGALVTLFGVVAPVIGLVGGTLTALAIPIGIVVAAVAALAAAWYGLKTAWDLWNVEQPELPPPPKELTAEFIAASASAELLAQSTANADAALADIEGQSLATAAATAAATAEQKAYNDAVNNLVKEFSGTGLLEQARQYEDALTRLGGATNLTIDEQIEFATVFQSVIDKYSAMGPKGAAVVAHFAELKDTLISATSALSTEYLFEPYALSAADAYAATEQVILGLDEFESSKAKSALNTEYLFEPYTISAADAYAATEQLILGLDEFESKMPTATTYVYNMAQAFLQLGNIIPGVTGSILTFVGHALNGFLTILSAIDTVRQSVGLLQTGFNQGFSLSGISNVVSGIAGIAGAAMSAISVVASLGSAIVNAFKGEVETVVNPNRDLFFAQFIGQHTDPFTALGESMITAAMQVYGVDRDTAWLQYAEPLMKQIYAADTFGELTAAQLAIGELFRKAGVAIDIYNEAGIAQQYQSNVFDQGPGFAYAPLPTNITDPGVLASYGTTVTDQLQSSVTGSYAGAPYGGSTFQTGTMPSMGGSGLCIYIQNMYVGSTGQAQSFFQQLYDYIAGGGEGMEKFRDLVCAATPA